MQDSLIFTVSDVSGKGIPAALFMMRAKATLKNYIVSGDDLNIAIEKVNEDLCKNNDTDMFVTSWIGSLNLKTGLLQFVNAGHNYPLIKKNNEFSYLNTRPNFVLAGMEGCHYKVHEVQLNPGDELFLYTDGVTEACNNENELYGDNRLLEALNEQGSLKVKERCMNVSESVEAFVQNAPQSDDITMMCIQFFG